MAEWQTTDPAAVIGTDVAHDIEYGFAATGIGRVMVAWAGTHICWFMPGAAAVANTANATNNDTDAKRALVAHWQPAQLQRDDQRAVEHAAALLEAPAHAPLLLRGTEWQLKIWQALRGIRAGETVSYAELAERAGANRSAARAAGSAVGANHIALAVPCHRVLPASGGPGGFRWGAQLKRSLLVQEQSAGSDPHGRAA